VAEAASGSDGEERGRKVEKSRFQGVAGKGEGKGVILKAKVGDHRVLEACQTVSTTSENTETKRGERERGGVCFGR